MGFPDGSDSQESSCKAGDPGLAPGLGRPPGERNVVFLSGEIHGQRLLAGYSPWGLLNRTEHVNAMSLEQSTQWGW